MPAWSPLLKKVLIVGIPTATTVGYFLNNTVAAEDPSVHRQLNDELHQATVKQSSEKNKESTLEKALTLEQAQRKTRDLSHQSLIINGYPGIVFGVSYKGKPIWVHGFGYENLETNKKCSKDTVMRIASISKPLTMLIVAKLVEEGKLDLDKNINEYLGDKFPHKKFNNKTVNITLRQLASHFSGVRSYHPGEVLKLNSYYENAVEAMELFKNDDLLSESGSKFTYSTFAYTVIAAVVESVLPDNQTFGDYLIKVCRHDLGMTSTYLDNNSNIILNRAGQYTRKDGKLYNSPYVDCSYKYAGGGILSTIPDLLRFGNIMLYSYLDDGKSPGYLKSSTVDLLWSPIENSNITLLPDYKSWSSYGRFLRFSGLAH